jgi:hypothetical protein
MDSLFNELSNQLNVVKSRLENFKDNDSTLKRSEFVNRAVLVRPGISKTQEGALPFLEPDGSGYKAGPGFREAEQAKIMDEKIVKCLKID